MTETKSLTVLLADDDEEDRLMARDAWRESAFVGDLHFVEDGEDLMDYLRRRGRFQDTTDAPTPNLVLLDLNMPRKDGREALVEIKRDPVLRSIPVVVLTTSKRDEDVLRSYQAGASSFIVKPVTFEGLVTMMREIRRYWADVVTLP